MKAIAIIQDEHRAITSVIEGLRHMLVEVAAGRIPVDHALLGAMFHYIETFPEKLHHPKEDLVFAKIKERDSTMARIVDDLHRQHARIHAAGAELVRQLDDIVNGSIASRAAIEAAARDYVDGLRKHMRVEESDVLPHAATLLNGRDWSAIHAAIGRVQDPLFGKHPEHRYASLRQQISRDAHDADRPAAGIP